MSKFVLRGVLLCAAGLVSLGVMSAQAKVGIVNIQKAILETAEIKKAQTALEAKYRPRQAELEKLQKELTDIQAQLDKAANQQAAQELQARGQRRQRGKPSASLKTCRATSIASAAKFSRARGRRCRT